MDVEGTDTLRTSSSNTGTSILSALTIGGSGGTWTGKLDITNNAVILLNADSTSKMTAISNIQAPLANGRNGGSYNANGITTTSLPAITNTSLVLVDNGDIGLGLTSFRGATVNSNSLIVTLAHDGNANLDNSVDAADFNILGIHWLQTSEALLVGGRFYI